MAFWPCIADKRAIPDRCDGTRAVYIEDASASRKNIRFAKILAIGLAHIKSLSGILAFERGMHAPAQDGLTIGAEEMRGLLNNFIKEKSAMRIFAFFVSILMLECAGARAYAVASAHPDPSDFCSGYAICL
jgi:hypothetical protein